MKMKRMRSCVQSIYVHRSHRSETYVHTYFTCFFLSSFKITSLSTGFVQGQVTHSVTLPLFLHYIKPSAIVPIFMITPLHYHQQMLLCGMYPVNH